MQHSNSAVMHVLEIVFQEEENERKAQGDEGVNLEVVQRVSMVEFCICMLKFV